MSKGQVIRLNGNVAALVVDGEARIMDGLSEPAMLTVKGMCLFAMEVQAGVIDPPYTDERALAYARLADRRRVRSTNRR
jgi:hypothetical protein